MSKESDIAENPKAFPHDTRNSYTGGMTLRDYFAAKAMQGYLSVDEPGMSATNIAKESYKQADAMLEGRQNGH